MKKRLLLVLTLLIALVLAACSNDDDAAEKEEPKESTDTQEQQELEEVEITEEEQADANSVVAIVNGTELLGSEYNNIYKQLKTYLHMNGQDTNNQEMLKEGTIANLIDLELQLQDAEKRGIEVTEEEAQEEMDKIVETNGEEVLTVMLEELELTEDEFLKQLVGDLVRIEYRQSEFEVEVTDEEVEEQYELLKEQTGEEIGELEENEEGIRQQISFQKQMDELRDTAEIETLI